MTEQAALKIAFLGDRLIARRVLELMRSDAFRSRFDIACFVSGRDLLDAFKDLATPECVFLENNARHNDAIRDAIEAHDIKALISIQHNWVLGCEVLDAVGGRAFNLHNAKLPEYKGYNSISHALLNGDPIFTSTLHWMAKEVDSGPVIFEEVTEVSTDDSAYSLYPKTVDRALHAVTKLLSALSEGAELPSRPMEQGVGKFYGRDDIKAHLDVTDVADPRDLRRIVQSVFFPPYNVAFKRVAGQRVYLLPEAGGTEVLETASRLNR